ncbi:MAG TPA: S41 family peptidase [Patescibacteria group bacterium]|nr:S41 family peptidase [Patescibacteria group bacterium]
MSNIRYPFSKSLIVLTTLLFVFVSFTSGLFIGRQQGRRAAVPIGEGQVTGQDIVSDHLAEDVDFGLYWDVWNAVKDRFYHQPVSDKELFYGSLKGMFASLGDPYTVFFDPKEAKEFQQDLSGSFEGIGAEIGIKDKQLQIVAPLSGSPAEQAGLKTGDFILAIDGKATDGMSVEEAVFLIRGARGTTVVFSLFREGWKEPQNFSVVRDTITVDSLVYEMRPDGVAVIRIAMFNDETPSLFVNAVNEILNSGAKGVILDLRGDPGGLLTAAIDIASAWIGPQPVVLEKSQGNQRVYTGSGSERLAQIPTMVLVNGGSASASEIVSGALQDYGLATLIGTQTFGKGSVQDYSELPDGSAIKITEAEWLTPKGRSINEIGIEPDVTVEWTEEDMKVGRDPQMNKALELLMGTIVGMDKF